MVDMRSFRMRKGRTHIGVCPALRVHGQRRWRCLACAAVVAARAGYGAVCGCDASHYAR
jgi:hypothetical protein